MECNQKDNFTGHVIKVVCNVKIWQRFTNLYRLQRWKWSDAAQDNRMLIAKLTVQHQNWQTNALSTDLTSVNSII